MPWAPDVSFHNGVYWMYYAVVATGVQQEAAIGLATSTSGLPGTWVDHGPVLASHDGDDFNAIDPSLLVDESGNWRLVFGSFFHGIYMVALDPSTGQLADPSAPTFYHLAEHPTTPTYRWYDDDIEGATIYHHGSYYYLFASAGRCCRGTSSTSYHIVVGRSTTPTGPYVDNNNSTDMLQGGGTTILASHDEVIGPGGQSVMFDPGNALGKPLTLLIYHYYNANLDGEPTLGINALFFDTGWPVVF
jgi:arabinan endo-1,5-alpha-L-arabinosidase